MPKDPYLERQIARIKAAFVMTSWHDALDALIADSGAIIPGRKKTINVVEWQDGGWSNEDFDLDAIITFAHGGTLYTLTDAYLFSVGPFGILVALEAINVTLGLRCVMLLAWDTNTGNIYRVPHATGGAPLSEYIDLESALDMP